MEREGGVERGWKEGEGEEVVVTTHTLAPFSTFISN